MSLEAIKQVNQAEEASRARLAEAQAARHAAQVTAETRQACDGLRAKAETRLDDAAESIVRRVVKN